MNPDESARIRTNPDESGRIRTNPDEARLVAAFGDKRYGEAKADRAWPASRNRTHHGLDVILGFARVCR
jgi:hypothetical protein